MANHKIKPKQDAFTVFDETTDCKTFLKVIKSYKKFRVGVTGNKKPFTRTFFGVTKKEVRRIIKFGQDNVRYSIMNDINGNPETVFIIEVTHTILD